MKLESIFFIEEGEIKIKPIAYEYDSIAKFIKYHNSIQSGYLTKEFAYIYNYLSKDIYPTKKGRERAALIKLKLGFPTEWKQSTQLKSLIAELKDDFKSPTEMALETVYTALTVCTGVTTETLENMEDSLKKMKKLNKDDNDEERKERLDYIKMLQSELINIMKIATQLPNLIQTTADLEEKAKKEVVNDVIIGKKKATRFED